jgi:mitotic spindle assembly checkpoint protein MAD2B
MIVEVAIHGILYMRQVYPAHIFVRRRKYNLPVFQAVHPELNEYISGVIEAIAKELCQVICFPSISRLLLNSLLNCIIV